MIAYLIVLIVSVVCAYYSQQYFYQNHSWRVRDPQLVGLIIFLVVMVVTQRVLGVVL